ncbi:MAG TPA: TonB-dependent receptor [Blastocatellia bacterium]|nr:TonB-dependent receptor [Blastocatellia bacterium]
MHPRFSVPLRALVCAMIVLSLCAAARAQFTASIQGTVTDASGAIVSGATVTVTNNETGRSQQVTASDEGFYRVTGLAPGVYTVSAELSGFRKTVIENVIVNAEAPQGVNIALETGEITESVTVSADEATTQLETETASVSRAITTAEILRLPQVGRDPYELIRLTPGVFGDGGRSGSGGAVNIPNTAGPGGSNSSIFQVENQVQISANGQRVSANNFQIDGVSVNSLGWGGAAVVTPNQESVKEIRVLSSTYSAEDGRNSGAQIKVVSQNGTNEFHGSALFKYNDPGLNAFNKFDGPTVPRQRVEQRFRQFGGSLGGPILRDRLFFFFSYEGLRNNTSRVRNAFVETPELRQLIIDERPNSLAAQLFGRAGIEPRIQNVIPVTCAQAVQPNTECRQVGSGLDLGSPIGALGTRVGFNRVGGGLDNIPDVQLVGLLIPGRERGHQFNTRFDFNLNSNNRFALSSYFTRRDDIVTDFGNTNARPVGDLGVKPLNTAVTLTYDRILSATMLNEARFNFTRFAFNQVEDSADADFGIPRIKVEGLNLQTGIPGIGQPLQGGDIFFGAARFETTPGIFAQNTFEFRDTLSKVVGNFGLKFGVEVRKEQDNNNLLGGARPEFSFFTFWDLANDAPILEVINTDPRTGAAADAQRYFRTSTYALFAQNDWKVRRNLTLNLGLRWEYFTPLREKEDRLSNFIPGPPGQELTGGRVQVVDELYEPDRNNFAPRIGFAWSPGRFQERVVLRGGFGVSYNRIFNNILSNVRGNPPFFARNFVCCAFNDTDVGVIERIFYTFGANRSPLSFPPNPNITPAIDPNTGGLLNSSVELFGAPEKLPNAYVYTYSLDTEYLLPFNMIASLGYQGSSSHKLLRTTNLNFLFDADNPSFFQIFFPQPDVNANYNAMNARLSRRFANGFQVDGIYRWSKSIDTVSFEFGGGSNQTDPRDIRQQRGPSDFDVKHHFVLSGLWDLPIFRGRRDLVGKVFGGWQINGILTLHSGFPWTPVHCNDLNGDGQGCFERAAQYFGGARESSNDNFTSPAGIFPGGGLEFFDITTPGTPAVGRNSFRGPNYRSVDFGLAKTFGLPNIRGLGEGANLEIRANFFNAFNTLNLLPFNFGTDSTIITSGNFGRALGAQAGRIIEFQGRFRF